MGAIGRVGNWKRQLPSTPDCALDCLARSVCWFAGESGIRTYVLVEPAGTERPRSRYGTNARSALAKRAMGGRLHLQGCARRHGGGAWIALSATLHYSVVENSHCPPGIGRKLFRRAVFAAGARAKG